MKKQTLLVIEDDPFQQQQLKIWLETAGYAVVVADNGEQALAEITEHNPDLILLDLIMPGINGFEVVRKLKATPETRRIAVVIVTALDAHDKRIEALELGVDDFLSKPIDRIELLVRVNNLLQNRAYFKQLQDRRTHLMQLENMASLGTLIASITHEINKPLQALQAIFQQAQVSCAENPQILDLLAQAGEQGERIDTIVHNMGLYIKSIAKQQPTQSCNINDILEQVLELLDDKLAAAGIRIETDIAADLPLVSCNADGVMHVLVHLILNAYEALQDCPQPCIKIGIMPLENQQLVISVCDNNAEADSLYSLILDPLFSTKLPEISNSLGLALACHFVEESGGSISVDSAAGHGCCMRAVFKTAAHLS